ncbi:hypothetical protein CYMTET_6913 [Cymbomonas tetramitiformis]|uniref:Uncharacterized protein n=1 Tax=Cymbomonas tetramitiformis TaxID=36881 RepID=A0AAE0LHL2_9CHLO|nr:hypothetical protein CYMTET_6913 [Cymbomonas tetramitiformis]
MLRLHKQAAQGLTEDDLSVRIQYHRGVYCKAGLLTPSSSTIYIICPAQLPSDNRAASIEASSQLCGPSTAASPADQPLGETPKSDERKPQFVACKELQTLAEVSTAQHMDIEGYFYVLQIEIDLLASPVTKFDTNFESIVSIVNKNSDNYKLCPRHRSLSPPPCVRFGHCVVAALGFGIAGALVDADDFPVYDHF